MPPVRRTKKKLVSSRKKVKKKSSSLKEDILSIKGIREVDYKNDDPVNISIWGGSGTGKTTLWSSFPGPILALFCSGGLKNPGELKSLTRSVRDQITPLVISHIDQIVEVIEKLEKDTGEFLTISLDHLSSIVDLVICDIMGIEKAKPQKDWGDMDQQDWGRVASAIKIVIRDLMDLPVNFVCVSQERMFEAPEESQIAIDTLGPAVTPSIAKWIHSSFDYSVRTFIRKKKKEVTKTVNKKKVKKIVETEEDEYCLWLPRTSDMMTKFRHPPSSNLDPVIVSPTYEKLISAIG